jgi:hypothetical protein
VLEVGVFPHPELVEGSRKYTLDHDDFRLNHFVTIEPDEMELVEGSRKWITVAVFDKLRLRFCGSV